MEAMKPTGYLNSNFMMTLPLVKCTFLTMFGPGLPTTAFKRQKSWPGCPLRAKTCCSSNRLKSVWLHMTPDCMIHSGRPVWSHFKRCGALERAANTSPSAWPPWHHCSLAAQTKRTVHLYTQPSESLEGEDVEGEKYPHQRHPLLPPAYSCFNSLTSTIYKPKVCCGTLFTHPCVPSYAGGESKQVSLLQRCLFVCLCVCCWVSLPALCKRGAEIFPAIGAHACGCGTGGGVEDDGVRVSASVKWEVQPRHNVRDPVIRTSGL